LRSVGGLTPTFSRFFAEAGQDVSTQWQQLRSELEELQQCFGHLKKETVLFTQESTSDEFEVFFFSTHF
jgi:hypothetical protein